MIAVDGKAIVTDAIPLYRCATGKRRGGWDAFFDFPPAAAGGTRQYVEEFHPTRAIARTWSTSTPWRRAQATPAQPGTEPSAPEQSVPEQSVPEQSVPDQPAQPQSTPEKVGPDQSTTQQATPTPTRTGENE